VPELLNRSLWRKKHCSVMKNRAFYLFLLSLYSENPGGDIDYMCVNSMKYSANRRDNELQCLNYWTDHPDGKITVQSCDVEHFTFYYFICPVKIQVGTLIYKYVYYVEYTVCSVIWELMSYRAWATGQIILDIYIHVQS